MTEFDPSDRIVTVFGGSGFIGRHLVRALARDNWRVRVATRRPDLAFHLQPLGRVGQVNAVQANVRYPDSLAAALRGADAAVNLVGILAPWGKQTFDSVQAEGAGAVARAVAEAGLTNFVHMSAIGADARSHSAYARTKAAGRGRRARRRATRQDLRPSVVFGPEDQFFNRFAAMARLTPALPLIGGGKTKLQPVYVGDVAEAGARLLRGEGQDGATYELGGPAVRTMKEIAGISCWRRSSAAPARAPAFLRRRAAGLRDPAVNKLLLGLLPEEFVFTADQVELLSTTMSSRRRLPPRAAPWPDWELRRNRSRRSFRPISTASARPANIADQRLAVCFFRHA